MRKAIGAVSDRANAPKVQGEPGEKTATAVAAQVRRPKSERIMAAKVSQNRDPAAPLEVACEKQESKPLHPSDEPCSSHHPRKAGSSKHERSSTTAKCSALERRVNEEVEKEVDSGKHEHGSLYPNGEQSASRHSSKAASSKRERSPTSSQHSALERLVREQALQVKLLIAEKEKMMAEKEKKATEAKLKCKLAALELQHETQRNNLEEAISLKCSISISGVSKTAEWVQQQSEFVEPQRCSSYNPMLQDEQQLEAATGPVMAAAKWRPADHIAARQVWPKKLPSSTTL